MSNCNCSRLIDLNAKCNDLCFINIDNKYEHEGYVPSGLNIGSGDYIKFKYCIDCGKIQGNWPLDVSDYLDDEND